MQQSNKLIKVLIHLWETLFECGKENSADISYRKVLLQYILLLRYNKAIVLYKFYKIPLYFKRNILNNVLLNTF